MTCEVFRINVDWFRVWYGDLGYGVLGAQGERGLAQGLVWWFRLWGVGVFMVKVDWLIV